MKVLLFIFGIFASGFLVWLLAREVDPYSAGSMGALAFAAGVIFYGAVLARK